MKDYILNDVIGIATKLPLNLKPLTGQIFIFLKHILAQFSTLLVLANNY